MGEFWKRISRSLGHADAVMAVGVIGLVMLLIIPLPPFLLDALLCLSIVFSVMALLLTLYVENALEFSAFPSLLLFLTLYRLGLNVASTRMILTRGEGGDIINTFGNFVTHGNVAVGVILFGLLTLINFVVVTKGAGRIAEVAARFTLEALPGKQAAIDGELSAGLIAQGEAKEERERVGQEAEFYGAMDGASKFVRGDAIAGLVITFVNVVGGLAIGLTMKNMGWQSCFETFTRLTVGDGLVSQIPALLLSVAAGIMMTRASKGSVGKALTKQVFHHPKVLLIAGSSVCVLGLVPGMPFFMMSAIGAAFLGGAYVQMKQKPEKREEKEASLFVHPVEVELGYEAVSLAEPLMSRLPEVRKKVAAHLGVRVPQVEIRDSGELPGTGWQIKVKGRRVATGRDGDLRGLERELVAAIEGHAYELLTRQDVAQMLQEVKRVDGAVVEELMDKRLSVGQLTRVLQNLLKEGVPIRDFVTILECLADQETSDIRLLSESVRSALGRGICEAVFGGARRAHAILIDPKVEQMLGVAKGKVRPAMVDKLARSLIALSEEAERQGVKPVVVTETGARAELKRLIEKQLPKLPVLSYTEVEGDIELETLGTVSNDVMI